MKNEKNGTATKIMKPLETIATIITPTTTAMFFVPHFGRTYFLTRFFSNNPIFNSVRRAELENIIFVVPLNMYIYKKKRTKKNMYNVHIFF